MFEAHVAHAGCAEEHGLRQAQVRLCEVQLPVAQHFELGADVLPVRQVENLHGFLFLVELAPDLDLAAVVQRIDHLPAVARRRRPGTAQLVRVVVDALRAAALLPV
jgi:hypothetical protein